LPIVFLNLFHCHEAEPLINSEADTDQLVYELYGLTDEEVKVVESGAVVSKPPI